MTDIVDWVCNTFLCGDLFQCLLLPGLFACQLSGWSPHLINAKQVKFQAWSHTHTHTHGGARAHAHTHARTERETERQRDIDIDTETERRKQTVRQRQTNRQRQRETEIEGKKNVVMSCGPVEIFVQAAGEVSAFQHQSAHQTPIFTTRLLTRCNRFQTRFQSKMSLFSNWWYYIAFCMGWGEGNLINRLIKYMC